jgi:hypothetical protein
LAVRGAGGFTIAEATLATAVVGMGFLAVFNTNAYQLKLVKKTRETNAASLALQERVETMRISNWRQMTNASYVAGTLMLSPTQSSGPLSALEESITVSAYPDPSVCQPLTVVRNASGIRTTPSGGTGLSDQRIARVDLSVSWLGSNGQTFQRSSSTLISNSGISRLNLANNSTGTGTTGTGTTGTGTTGTGTTSTGTTSTGTTNTGTTGTGTTGTGTTGTGTTGTGTTGTGTTGTGTTGTGTTGTGTTGTGTTGTGTTGTGTTGTGTTGTGTTGTGSSNGNGNGNGNGNSNANSNPHGNTGGKNGKG